MSQITKYSEDTAIILNFPRTEQESACFPYYDWFTSICVRFDKTFIYILVIENINFGISILIALVTQDLFKAYMNCDPDEMQIYITIVSLPWVFKILYGLISDNVPICGLKRRPYLIFFGFNQFIAFYILYTLDYSNTSPLTVVLLLTWGSLNTAFSNVVYDAVLIVQSRKDIELGSQDLISLAWLTQGISGVVGCLMAALMMENYNPKWTYLGYAIYGFFLGVSSFFLTTKAEREYNKGEEPIQSDFSSEVLENQTPSQGDQERKKLEDARPPIGEEGFWYNFKRNMRIIWKSLQQKEIYCIVIFFILDGLTSPNFSTYTYFFLMDVIHVSKFVFAMIVLVSQVMSVVSILIYQAFLRKTEVRTVLFYNVFINITGAFLAFSFAMRWNLAWGINDIVFLFFTDIVFGAVGMAFSTMPILALFAKLTPKRVEGTMYAFFTGTSNLDGSVIGPMMGVFINSCFVGCSKNDLSGYPKLMFIALVFSFFGFFLLPLIPLKKDVEEANKLRDEEEVKLQLKRKQNKIDRRKKRQEYKDSLKANEGGNQEELQNLIQ